MNKITRKAAAEMVWMYKRLGLIDHYKTGYCVYQDDGVSKFDMVELGYNTGVPAFMAGILLYIIARKIAQCIATATAMRRL